MPRRSVFIPRGCLPWLLVLLALPGVRAAGAAGVLPVGEGQPFVQYFSPRDFHGDTYSTCMTQDARGVMYIGNSGMVLEYDGTTWRQIPTHEAAFIAGLAYDVGTDTVFVGTADDLGFLKTEPGGAHTYVSLRDRLPTEARGVGDFRGVHATPEGVFFVCSDRVLRWREGRFETWKLATESALRSYWAAGHLYVASKSLGLRRLENEEFVPVSDDPVFHQTEVRTIIAQPDGELFIATSSAGFFVLRQGVASPAGSECDPFFKEMGVQSVIRLRDGSLAVATLRGGVVILDPARRFRSRVDKAGGLNSNNIYGLFEDAEGGVWVGQVSGVARVEIDPSLSVIRAGPDEDMSSVSSSGQWCGAMAFGSGNGIHRLAPADPAAAAGPRLELVAANLGKAPSDLCPVANGIMVNNEDDIVLLDCERKQVSLKKGEPVAGLIESRLDPGRAYYTEANGRIGKLRLDAATQRWIDDGLVANLGVTTGRFNALESPVGDLWVGTAEHGLFRVQFDPAGPARVTSFFDRPGPLHGLALASPCNGDRPLVIETSQGHYQFDDASQSFVPLTAFGERLQDPATSIGELYSYDAHSLWLIIEGSRDPGGEGFCGRIIAGGPGHAPVYQSLPHKIEEVIGAVGFFFPVEEPPGPLKTVLLVGTTGNGIVRLDVPRWETQGAPRPFTALIRRAFTTRGDGAANESPILREPLEYARNTAHFEYSAGTLAFGTAPRFQTRLVNFGAGAWSDWSARSSVDYLNLPEGNYTFEVRARNSDGQLGGVASMPFRVLPPWQRSPWAYAAYLLAAAGGVYALVRWRGRQLRRRNVALETLVDSRTGELRGREAELLANEGALIQARNDAESANRAKSAFLANMSHELRTPLNAVLGYTQLLLKEPDLTPRSRERITVIGQSGGHLLSLVNEVLDLSKVEAGKLTLSPFDFSLGRLLDEVSMAFRPRLAEKGLTFVETRAPGLPVTVHTDPSRLRQVLFNLLSNAVKFTERGGVTLMARPTDGQRVRFEVADTGVGIAPGEQRDIFVAFHQTGESSLASQGTGLGLAISQRLVELLGGHIELESAPGRGSRFWFELPISNVEAADGGASKRVAQDAALGRITGYEGETRRLLIVDDLPENRQVLCDFLQPLGFEIEEAADGAACLAACARQTPDGVLLDLRLGAMDGFEVARTLRTRLGGAALSIIAISASVFETDRQQAIDAGCDDFLPKPFEEAQLLGTLGRVLGLRWTRETPAVAEPFVPGAAVGGGETLPADELALLRELSLRGDAAGIHRRLDAWRAEGTPGHAVGIAHRLEVLVAAYDMETMHAWLLTLHPHDGN